MLDITVHRIYECLNPECKIEITVEQSSLDDFIKTCPNCELDELVIKSGKCGLGIQIDTNTPKTLGSLAEKNAEQRRKNGESIAPSLRQKTPYKDGYKCDYSILKDPKKYIMTGKK